jgi:hypothetical protein
MCLASSVATVQAGSGFYLGPTVGIMDADFSGFDDATGAGVLLGYEFFSREAFYLSAEAEATTTIADGDVKAAGRKGDWDIDSQALYLAARVGNTFYIKVRYGVSWSEISVNFDGSSFSNSDSGGSWGGALGWNLAEHWVVQADGILVDTDVTYWNLGLNYRF